MYNRLNLLISSQGVFHRHSVQLSIHVYGFHKVSLFCIVGYETIIGSEDYNDTHFKKFYSSLDDGDYYFWKVIQIKVKQGCLEVRTHLFNKT